MTEPIVGLAASVETLAEVVARLAASVQAERLGELLTAEDLAERLKIPARTIKDQASAGRLPHHRFGKHYRFSRDDITEILRITKQQAVPRAGRRLVRAA
ncbi:MAG: helix-turn-helix domain-containing protein [Nocardioidaceae bacterium]